MTLNFTAAPTSIYPLAQQGPFYGNAHTTSQQPSPNSSTTDTPVNGSPTSQRRSSNTLPHLVALQSRQLRPPKAPLYVPAVLRPTERPVRASPPKQPQHYGTAPLTPPPSAGNSWDGTNGSLRLESDGTPRKIRGEVPAPEGITRIVTDEWNAEVMEPVTGAPTRDHWQPDSSTNHCNELTCHVPFTLLTRRHHCRRCGDIFCSPHTAQSVPLDQHARFHPQGVRGRVCASCWLDYNAWYRVRLTKTQSASSTFAVDDVKNVIEKSSSKSEPATPTSRRSIDKKPVSGSIGPADGTGRGSGEMISSSVRGDWNWSTF